MLSGGASLGKYHYGVFKALYENDLLPRVVVGSSVGSFVSVQLCSLKYDEVWKIFANDNEYIKTQMFPTNKSMAEALQNMKDGKPIQDLSQIKNVMRSAV